MRIIFLISILIAQQSVFAYSSKNIIDFYRIFYEKEVGVGFFKKEYETKDQKLRDQILTYMKENNLEVNDSEIEINWQNFIKLNFTSPIELQNFIENNYYNTDQAKIKFIEDIDLKRYFDQVITKKLEKDFKLRDKLSTNVITAKMTEIERLEAEKQFLAIVKVNSLDELKQNYHLDKSDLDYLITSNFLLEKKSYSLYNLDLQKRIFNLTNNSKMSKTEAKNLIFRNYENRAQYLY
jgi:hypothetical protein